ncbi:MAG: (d)CMP kinase [Victivallaceae bacterium]|nr:(d)CMP kinase [Victivallaceae bacterium]
MSKVIAIDGPAASGKSTVASCLAERFNIACVNTGSLYRAVALAALRTDIGLDAIPVGFLHKIKLQYAHKANGGVSLKLNGSFVVASELRAPEIADGASKVATQPAVREFLLDVQRSFAGRELIVMEGRDIGTVIFPDAEYKFFVTASPEERARRRLAQSGEVNCQATLAEVARSIAERDRQDSTRAVAPLKPADDATVIDTTGMTIDEVVEKIASVVEAGEKMEPDHVC